MQGAVIYGVEKSRHQDACYMFAMTRSYGVVIDGDFKWLARKGDLVLSKEKRTITGEWFKIARGEMENYQMALYVYEDDDGTDDVPDFWLDGQHSK